MTREKNIADYFEEAVKVGTTHMISSKQIANFIINRKIDIDKTLPARLIESIVESSKTEKVDESKLNEIITRVLKNNEKAISDYKKGKKEAIMFLVGQVMRAFKEKIDASLVAEKIKSKI